MQFKWNQWNGFNKYDLFSQLPRVKKNQCTFYKTLREGNSPNCFYGGKNTNISRECNQFQALRSDNIWSLNWPAAVHAWLWISTLCKLKTPELSDTTSLIGSSGMFPPQYSSRRPRFSLSFSPLFYCLLRFKSEERGNKSRIREACKNVPSSPPEDLMEPPRLGADLKRGGGKKSVYISSLRPSLK